MQAYYVNHRINSAPGGESKERNHLAQNPFDLLNNSYQTADLGHLSKGVELMSAINNIANPMAIAMSIDEAREIFESGPINRRDDSRRFLATLDPNQLVILTPIGIDGINTHNEYLPDLALSGKNFPPITYDRVFPILIAKDLDGKTDDICPMFEHYDIVLKMLKRPQQPAFVPATVKLIDRSASGVPFPSKFTDTASCDKYFFANVDTVAKMIAERNGNDNDPEAIAAIALELNRLYSSTPEAALSRIHSNLTKPVVTKSTVDPKST